jgi:hypothetical protein
MSTSKKPRYAPLSPAATERLEPYRDLMGKRPDGEIAKLAGMDRRYVVVFRYYNDIPAYRRGSTPKPADKAQDAKPRRSRRSKLDEFRHLMGEVSDGRIAELAGCSREAVMRYRKRHGIVAAPRRRSAAPKPEPVVQVQPEPVAEPEQAPAPQPVPAVDDLPPEADEVLTDATITPPPAEPTPSAARLEGYVVTVRGDEGDEDYVLLANDLVDVANKALRVIAQRLPDARVIELRYTADLL